MNASWSYHFSELIVFDTWVLRWATSQEYGVLPLQKVFHCNSLPLGPIPASNTFPLPDAIALLKPASCPPSSNIKCSWAILESRIGILRELSRVHAPFLTSFANLPDVASRKASSDMRKDIRISSTWGLSECTVTGAQKYSKVQGGQMPASLW